MPSSLLFNFDHVDFEQRVVTPEEVGEMNPQTGPMRQLDYVVWANEDWSRAVGVKHVREDEFWVPHHIPGRPLMPGVLMIEAAAQLATVVHRKKMGEHRFMGFTRCDNVIFRDQVVPGDTLVLLVQEVRISPRRVVCHAQGVRNGAIAFEAKITGMAV